MKKFPLVATFALTAVILSLAAPLALAADAPPGLPDPFGSVDEDPAPPSFDTGEDTTPADDPTPPSFNTGSTGTTTTGGGDTTTSTGGSGGTTTTGGGGGSVILNDNTTPTPSSEAKPTTYTQTKAPTTDEQAVPETGPGLGLILIPALSALGINLRKKK